MSKATDVQGKLTLALQAKNTPVFCLA